MLTSVLDFGFFYLVQGLVLGLLVFLFYRRLWKRYYCVAAYLFALFVLDGVSRRYVFYHFGVKSSEYFYAYWLTDVALALGAFLLVCAFFHRACANELKMWRFLRLFLILVFILALGISFSSISRNYNQLFYTRLIIEVQQNLYFTCLVLITLLYIMMQQLGTTDEELHMLVSGMGLQFAGPAASFALKFLTPGSGFTEVLMNFIGPLCTLGMLLTWSYAVTRKPVIARVPAPDEMVPARVTG